MNNIYLKHLFILLLFLLTVKCNPRNQSKEVSNQKNKKELTIPSKDSQNTPQGSPTQSTQGSPTQSTQGSPTQSTQVPPTQSTQGSPTQSTQGSPTQSTQVPPTQSTQVPPNIEELHFDNNILVLRKSNTRAIFQDTYIQKSYEQFARKITIHLFAVPSEKFDPLMQTIKNDTEVLKLHTGKRIKSIEGRLEQASRKVVLDGLHKESLYENYEMVLLDSNDLQGFQINDETPYMTIDLEQKTAITRTTDESYDETEANIKFLEAEYMDNTSKQWSKKWTKEGTPEYNLYLPKRLATLIQKAKVGDTYKTFFIILISSAYNSQIRPPVYTSYTAYVSGLDDPTNPYLVQEFTITD